MKKEPYSPPADQKHTVSIERMEQMMPLICERLAAGQTVKFSPHGVSMLPMLRQGKDSVLLTSVKGALKKYDLPLYRRRNGQYVLHRIVKTGKTYICMGDNQFLPEPGIEQDQLIAVVTAFTRGTKVCSVKSPVYRFYCFLWHHTRWIRRIWRGLKRRMKKLLVRRKN